jgi:hypothetical protein
LGRGLTGIDPSNLDQWLYTPDGWLTNYKLKSDTNLVRPVDIAIGEGVYWTVADDGIAYWRNAQWVLDYPDSTTLGYRFHEIWQGYTGHMFESHYRSNTGYIHKRDRLGGGVWTGVGKGSVKLSIDRDSSYVYCTTYGADTHATDYWRVASDLSEVLLIEQSEISGVYGGVHSQENAGVLCYGNIQYSLVQKSVDYGLSFTLYDQPPGIFNAIEASTVYTKRDNLLPDDVLITVTTSGLSHDQIYSYSVGSGWCLLASGNFIAESQVRRDTHSFLGVLLPAGTRLVDYSSDGGYSWEERDTFLPVITITDLEFA